MKTGGVFAFAGDAVQALLALAKGDSRSIAGRAKLTAWEKDGEEKHGLSVVADKVLTIYAAGKARKAARELGVNLYLGTQASLVADAGIATGHDSPQL